MGPDVPIPYGLRGASIEQLNAYRAEYERQYREVQERAAIERATMARPTRPSRAARAGLVGLVSEIQEYYDATTMAPRLTSLDSMDIYDPEIEMPKKSPLKSKAKAYEDAEKANFELLVANGSTSRYTVGTTNEGLIQVSTDRGQIILSQNTVTKEMEAPASAKHLKKLIKKLAEREGYRLSFSKEPLVAASDVTLVAYWTFDNPVEVDDTQLVTKTQPKRLPGPEVERAERPSDRLEWVTTTDGSYGIMPTPWS